MTGSRPPPSDPPAAEARDRAIPLGKGALVDALCARDNTAEQDAAALRRLGRWLSLLFHLEFFPRREALKDAYAPLDPDRPRPAGDAAAARAGFWAQLEPVLEAANYRPLPPAEVHGTATPARAGAKVSVPHERYSEVRFWGRGRREREYEVRIWMGLRRRRVRAPVYEHVVFAAAPAHGAPGRLVPGALYLRLLRDIPQADLVTLYPDARVVMGLIDRLYIGVPAVLGGVPILLNIVPALTVLLVVAGAWLGVAGTVEEDETKQALAAISGLGALGGFLLRQWTKYERQKLRYKTQVLDNAYFNTVNSNRGVFDFLIGASEDAEVKEALAAWAILSADGPMTEAALDHAVEDWLARVTGADVDFEVADAVAKLRRLALVEDAGGRLRAVPPDRAEEACRRAWARLAEDLPRRTEPGAAAL